MTLPIAICESSISRTSSSIRQIAIDWIFPAPTFAVSIFTHVDTTKLVLRDAYLREADLRGLDCESKRVRRRIIGAASCERLATWSG